MSANGGIELCLSDNDFDVDVLVKCSLKKMTEVWICQQRFSDAVKKGDIKVLGDPKLTNKLEAWLGSSPLSKLGSLGEFKKSNWREA